MADVIDYKIFGDDLQVVNVILDPNERVRAETGVMLYMENGIQMDTTTGGGLLKGLKRMITGESFFITTFTNTSNQRREISFSAPYPGKIIPIDLALLGYEFICQKDCFLCAAYGVDIEIAFTKRFGAGLFGGEGFILERLTGDGLTFIHAGGTVIEKKLDAGETLLVDTGCIVGFTKSVDYDIRMISGMKNMLFGGEGLFLAQLTGPGLVYLQSLPLSRLADRLKAATRGSGTEETKGLGGLLGNFISGD